jgi:hydroxyethylthiazole kinase-like uncharacterized protein yjeF
MRHIEPAALRAPLPLHGSAQTRSIESAATQRLEPHTLMERAGLAVFHWARALYPHARHVWVACGPGNNGGDGLLAAAAWQRTGLTRVTVTWRGNESHLPADARHALAAARAAGVVFSDAPPDGIDLAIDALLGTGTRSAPTARIAEDLCLLHQLHCPVLCVDIPSGLNPDTGLWLADTPDKPLSPRHTLSLLTLKPGLFTGQGRETSGDIWFDDLGVEASEWPADATLTAAEPAPGSSRKGTHNAHKGTHGDVIVLGGQDVSFNGQGMTGAAMLAARAGLNAGAGRVYVGLLGASADPSIHVDPLYPELMFRDPVQLVDAPLLQNATAVCGCGGGAAVHTVLPEVLQHSSRLVLDADALNAIASEPDWQTRLSQRWQRGQTTVLTPHPLEAARLLGTSTEVIQGNRLEAAKALAERYACTVMLKGSGTVICAPGLTPAINITGNALLATAGTGDVLAGMVGALLSTNRQNVNSPHQGAFEVACKAAHAHGLLANNWPDQNPFSASRLADAIAPP